MMDMGSPATKRGVTRAKDAERSAKNCSSHPPMSQPIPASQRLERISRVSSPGRKDSSSGWSRAACC